MIDVEFGDEDLGELVFNRIVELNDEFLKEIGRNPQELYIHSHLAQHIYCMDRYKHTKQNPNIAGLETKTKDWLPSKNIILTWENNEWVRDSVSWCYNIFDDETIWKTWS